MDDRDAIFSARDFDIERVTVPEWPIPIHVRSVTLGGARLLAEGSMTSFDGYLNLVLAGACREDGRLLFKPEDRERLEGKSHAAIERIAIAVLRVNGLLSEEPAKGKASHGPNSSKGSDGSPSSSPDTSDALSRT